MKLKDGNLVVDLHEAFSALLAGEHRSEVLESLSCHEGVLTHVCDQLLTRWTENGYHGSTVGAAPADCFTALDKARRRLAEGAEDFRAGYCRQLVAELNRVNERLKNAEEELNALKYPRSHE